MKPLTIILIIKTYSNIDEYILFMLINIFYYHLSQISNFINHLFLIDAYFTILIVYEFIVVTL